MAIEDLGADIHNTVQGGDDVKYFVVRGVRRAIGA
jgi:hypothetical protein